MKWPEVLELHARARIAFADAAASVPSEHWARAEEGVWSPAHIAMHLMLAYETLIAELNGGPGMSIRTKWWQRMLLRWTMVPGLLKGKPFPKGARAPKETRPVKIQENQIEAVKQFEKLAKLFEETAQKVYNADSTAQLTHAYFGRSDLVKSMQFCARHVLHHTRTLKP